MAFKPIQIIINAKDNASAVFGRLEGKVKAVGIAIAGYFGIKAFAGGIQGAADFEAAMSRVKAATDGTAEEMQQLTKAAQDAGANTKYTSIEAAGALENLAKAGLSAGDAIKALPAVLSLAQAGDVELAAASEYVTKAVMGMGLAFDDAARVADVLALGANATNTSVEGLAQALSYAAPVANTLGLSLESTVAIIGKFADAGIDASRAGTALNSILSQFANPASTFRRELGAAGIVTTDFEQALRQLAAKGPAGARAINAVGLEAGPALRALLNQGMGALDELTDKLNNAKGSAEATAKTMADNFNGSVMGLKSVWQSAIEVLNTPVLPILRKGIDDLAGAIRRSIEDGTVAKFGQVLATAFEQALRYFREFAANVNFDAVILRLQNFASETQEVLQRIGAYATNAGNTVQLAWGLMTAGTNAVLTVIYGIGSVFSEIASKVMSGVAMLRDGLASVTFGGLSESFRLAAEDARHSAEAFGAVAQEFWDRAVASLGDTATSAQHARDAWSGVTGAVEDANRAIPAVGKTVEQVAAQIEQAGQAALKAKAAAELKAESDRKAAEAVKRLKQEYESLIRSGNLQEAAKRLLEIDRAQQKLSGSAEKASEAAARIDEAYKALGLTSNTELKRMADEARAAFELLSKDGTQPPQRIADAWKVMAERVIEANGGIAPSWLKVEAAAKGYEITVDRAGKSVVNTEKATLRATGNMAKGYQALGKAADDANRRMQQVGGGGPGEKPDKDKNRKPGHDDEPPPRRPQSGDYNGLNLHQKDKERIDALRASGDHLVAANELRKIKWRQEYERGAVGNRRTNSIQNLVPVFQTEQELDAWWKEWQRQYREQNPFDVKSRGQLGSYMHSMTQFAVEGARKQIKLQQAANAARPQPVQPAPAPQAPKENRASELVAKVYRHEIALGGKELGVIETDEAGSTALQQLLGELERGRRMSGGGF